MMAFVMDSLSRAGLFNGNVHNINMNANTTDGANRTSTFMDTLLTAGQSSFPHIQVLLFIQRFLGIDMGLDPSVILTLAGLLWGLHYVLVQAYLYIEDFIDRHFMCSIAISQDDSIYYHVMEWMSKQPRLANHRFLTAQSIWRSAWEEDENDADGERNLFWTDAGQGGRKYLNFSNHAARSVPQFVPAMGGTRFWHNRTLFRLYRKKESLVNVGGYRAMKDQEEITISCYGRSITPIKKLLVEAKMVYYHDTHQKTTIYRPRHKEQRRDSSMWQQVAHRPVRPMNTVVLDSTEKHDVLGDINEYLHPRTPRWYAARGIPLRRGYLFHGPPGTGKTSFSFALAGVFGIDIYVISLQDASVTEEDLAILFTRLPRRCIVLLEDIDTAGLRRGDDGKSDDEKNAEGEKAEKKKEGDSPAKEVNGVSKKKSKKSSKNDSDVDSDSGSESSDDDRKKKLKKKAAAKKKKADKVASLDGISLSGLLNAIDGVASHEGRVLIMTTNKPESLDEALVRPGRVDRQVAFSHATSLQAGELFRRMYEAPWRRSDQKVQAISPSHPSSMLLKTASLTPNAHSAKESVPEEGGCTDEKLVNEEELKKLAQEFGQMIPENIFSPAEIQGFLLKRKNSPRKAFADVKEWIDATIKQKENKSKVSTIQ